MIDSLKMTCFGMNDLMFEFLNDTTDAAPEEKIIIFEFDDNEWRLLLL